MTNLHKSLSARRDIPCFAVLFFLMFLHLHSGFAQGLEPEDGMLAGGGNPGNDLYYGLIREALFGDQYRLLCGVAVIQSFSAERAVFMVRLDSGRFSVVSRKLKEHLANKAYESLRREEVLLRTESKAFLQKLQVGVETATAELDADAGNALSEVCKQVLLKTRYPEVQEIRLDGVTYHVGHSIVGAFLSGKTWSPGPETLAGKFIAMEEALAAYAEVTAARRDAARSDLLAKAAVVSAALKEDTK
jgi:hypothetical protein